MTPGVHFHCDVMNPFTITTYTAGCVPVATFFCGKGSASDYIAKGNNNRESAVLASGVPDLAFQMPFPSYENPQMHSPDMHHSPLYTFSQSLD